MVLLDYFVVSVITSCIVLILFIAEVVSFLSVQREESITVRDSTDDTIFIDFNLTVYNMTCRSSDWSSSVDA